ncbi:ParA family protein [Staphylococcus saprophyticus]|nr:ParA family protein [Staphylococcus saprophyticus]
MEQTKQPVFITVSMLKGGVGKTDIAFNFAMWLALEKDKKILGIDIDENCNFSQVMDVYDQEGTVANILEGSGEVKIHNINDNVDLIAGFNRLDDVQEAMVTSERKTMMLYMWLEDNYEALNINQYDFVIIDTHNDFGTATKNAMAVSHVTFSPIVPVAFSDAVTMQERLDEFRADVIDFKTRESYITTDLKLIANMVKHNTTNSREFEEHIAKRDDYIAKFPFKEIFNTSIQKKKSITELLAYPKNQSEKKFKKTFDENMNNMYEVVNKYQ